MYTKKGTFLTVAEEIQVLKNYIHLQEFRNGEEYQAAYAIEREAEQCLIPRLILQPLVENALIHGLDLKNNRKHLTIEAYTSGSRLYMKVRDNGRGMTQEQIEELLKKKGKKTEGTYGSRNTEYSGKTAIILWNTGKAFAEKQRRRYRGNDLSACEAEVRMKNHEKSITGGR